MRHRSSETSRSECKVELWTPWGVLRLNDRQNDASTADRGARKRLPMKWPRPADNGGAGKSALEPLA